MRILLVEDIRADAILLREALIDEGLGDELSFASDGAEALEVLRSGATLPQLVLLDLNLPRVDGREVLDGIRNDPRLQGLPVVVLSTSNSPTDVSFAYGHAANAYVRKPNGFDALRRVARSIADFWVHTATLPSPYAA